MTHREAAGASLTGRRRHAVVVAAALGVLGTVIRLPQIDHRLGAEHAFRQAQTLFAVRGYLEQGIDLRISYLPVFGEQVNVPFELPLFQALAALMAESLDEVTGTRLVALLAFQASALLLWILLRTWVGDAAGLFALALYEFLPFGLHWGTAPLIDFFSVALGLLMVFALGRWVAGGAHPWLLIGMGSTWMLLMVKVTTFPTMGMLLLLSMHLTAEQSGLRAVRTRALGALTLGPGVGVIALGLWTSYADRVKARSPLTSHLTSAALSDWNFGTMSQRIDPATYIAISGRVGDQIVGPGLLGIALSLAITVVLGVRRERLVLNWLLVAALSSPLIFLNLYYVHSYYLICVFPVLVAIVAVGAGTLMSRFDSLNWRLVSGGGLGAAVLCSVVMTASGRADLRTFLEPVREEPEMVRQIERETSPTDKVIIVGCDWNPVVMYLSHRTGVMLSEPSPRSIRRYAEGEYRYIGLCAPGIDLAALMPAGWKGVQLGDSSVYQLEPK